MTKMRMLAEIYAVLSVFYGQRLEPGYKVLTLKKEHIETLYNVYRLNKKDTLSEQVRTLEAWIVELIDIQQWNNANA